MAFYAENHGPNVTSLGTLEQAIKSLDMFFKGMRLEGITEVTCRGYYNFRNELWADRQKAKGVDPQPISGAHVRRELSVLIAACNFANKCRLIDFVPDFWLPEDTGHKERFLTRSELARLLWATRRLDGGGKGDKIVRKYMRDFILLGYYTGARKTAVLRAQASMISGDVIDFTQFNKGKKKYAKTPIHSRLKRFLPGMGKTYLINNRGHAVGDIKKAWAQLCRIARVDNATPYVLRHTMISHAVQGGVDFARISKFTGTSVRMIEKTYGHLAPEHLHDVLNALGKHNPVL